MGAKEHQGRALARTGARAGARIQATSDRPAAADSTRGLFAGDGAPAYDVTTAVEHLRAADRGLARAIDAVGPFRMRVDRAPSLFVALAQAIVYQQLTAKAAQTIFGRVCALAPPGSGGLTAEHVLSCADEPLRAAGLSGAKLRALRDLAERAVAGSLPSLVEAAEWDDEVVVDRLTQVRGVGRWTAQMLLMFRLGRPDVLPLDDYGIRKGFALVFRKRTLPEKQVLEARAARWRPYRTVASWYLWRALEVKDRLAGAGRSPAAGS
jgi:3-methyladenine DNA glycosylase/8-oxoguanine DNA glycosylase